MDKTDKILKDILKQQYEDKKVNIITGKLLNTENNQGISGAIIKIFKKEDNDLEVLKNITYSNKYGYFVIEEEGLGEFILKITSLGYKNKEQSITFNKYKDIALKNIDMDPVDCKDCSKISGIVTDKDNKPINLADVLLYHVSKEGELIPVAFQKTNELGEYKFINVPKGKYSVNATDLNNKF